jgi:signal transduction histidine kinase
MGFPVERVMNETRGIGLHLMKYHAAEAGLHLSLASAPEKGTIVRVVYRPSKLRGDTS